MKVCITAKAAGLEAPVEPRFARAPFFVFIDTETGEIHSVANALCTGHGGVGPRVVQFVAEYGAEALVTGRLGENADRALLAARIPVYEATPETTVGEALDAFRLCALREIT
ncbi:MAG: NifB/NifX family molybdenum-iron cluster-binding protein [Methanospirillum sp.]